VGGSFAVWLAEQVGPAGFVLATDRQPRNIPERPTLVAVEHDLTTDHPYPGSQEGWDLIHARLTLLHMPQRHTILARLVERLAPGGWLLVEDWDASQPNNIVLSAASTKDAALVRRVQQALGRVFERAGTDRAWARQTYRALVDVGLTSVSTVMHSSSWVAGGAGCALQAGAIRQARDKLTAAGITDADLDRVTDLLTTEDPRLALAGHLMHSTSGRRPPDDGPQPAAAV
jgi:hypothetical protein